MNPYNRFGGNYPGEIHIEREDSGMYRVSVTYRDKSEKNIFPTFEEAKKWANEWIREKAIIDNLYLQSMLKCICEPREFDELTAAIANVMVMTGCFSCGRVAELFETDRNAVMKIDQSLDQSIDVIRSYAKNWEEKGKEWAAKIIVRGDR